MRLTCLGLYFFIISVLCVEESDKTINHRRYRFNHPPLAEDQNPIPVSVVYEDIVAEKSLTSNGDLTTEAITEQKSTPTEKNEFFEPKQENKTVAENEKKSEGDHDDIPVRPRSRIAAERHIPVAVIYDSASENTQNVLSVKPTETDTKRRKYHKIIRSRTEQTKIQEDNESVAQTTQKATTEEDIRKSSKIIEIETAKPDVLLRKEPVRLLKTELSSQNKSNEEEIKHKDRKQSRVRLYKTTTENKVANTVSTEATTTEKLNINVKFETETSNPIQPKTNFTNKRIESTRQNPSVIETSTTSVHTKRVRSREPVVPIVKSENYVYGNNGDFHYSYEGGDGTKAHSEGQLRSIDDSAGEAVSGGFSYTDKDGNDISLTYTADENGYRPSGAHLPTPPPIPPAIARALAYLATATTPEPVTKPTKKKEVIN